MIRVSLCEINHLHKHKILLLNKLLAQLAETEATIAINTERQQDLINRRHTLRIKLCGCFVSSFVSSELRLTFFRPDWNERQNCKWTFSPASN